MKIESLVNVSKVNWELFYESTILKFNLYIQSADLVLHVSPHILIYNCNCVRYVKSVNIDFIDNKTNVTTLKLCLCSNEVEESVVVSSGRIYSSCVSEPNLFTICNLNLRILV